MYDTKEYVIENYKVLTFVLYFNSQREK